MSRPRRRPSVRRTATASAPTDVRHLVERALERRAALLAAPQTDVGRLFHAAADGLDGLVVERFGPLLVAQLHEGRLAAADTVARDLCAEVAQRLGCTAVYRKVFPLDRSAARLDLERLHRDRAPWIGTPAPPELVVREAGLRFLVRPYDGYATGLFLDHRAARACIRGLAAGRRVLNTFAYTCAFSVAAALGAAAETTSVDISRRSLEWGKRNLAANDVELERHRFICADVFDYYRRAMRQQRRFDLAILDPPTFARGREARGTFCLADDLDRLVAGAIDLVAPDGLVYLSVNHRGTPVQRLEQAVRTAARAQKRRWKRLDPPPLPEDFHGDPDYAKSVLVRIG